LFAVTDRNLDELVPVTLDLLKASGLGVNDISWEVHLGNNKIYRRTRHQGDKITVSLIDIQDHKIHLLEGKCDNFVKGKTLPLGKIQFVKPTSEFPEIRLRFTPAGGKVYGASLTRRVRDKSTRADCDNSSEVDPNIPSEDFILYDKTKPWFGYNEPPDVEKNPTYTNPGAIFAGYENDQGLQTSWGYIDDECDGIVVATLKTKNDCLLQASAHIGAGPPAFAPDTLPIRVVSDELEQILLGTDRDGEVSIDEAEQIVRRAFETIRLMNTAVMNGNSFEGKYNIASTMVRQDTNDFNRLFEPIMATSLVDNLALRVLHERIFGSLSSGMPPWFASALRQPTEIGDLSNEARRKMPAMMRGADGRTLTFTYRQINTIIKAGADVIFQSRKSVSSGNAIIKCADLTAQLHYLGAGNPICVLPSTAISNCFPGLEFDFRNLWRRTFKGIVLMENNNFVVDIEDNKYEYLRHRRLVAVTVGYKDIRTTMVPTTGPVFPNRGSVPLSTSSNPNGVSFMEWSNSLADVLQLHGKEITCYFTKDKAFIEVIADLSKLEDYHKEELFVNSFFNKNSASISRDILQPGELTQGLCAPWQNDYRECACYYWAASRPDYVNVQPDENGISKGDNWMSKERTGQYLHDDRVNSRLLSYDDLFSNWEGELEFIIQGNDVPENSTKSKDHD
jgi:hypothetical protein